MRLAVAAALVVALAASAAQAQTAVKTKRRPQAPPTATAAPTLAPRPGVSLAQPGGRLGGGLATGGLAQGGLRASGDGGGVCRAACARSRYACEVADDSCAPQWAACLKSCSDSSGVSGGALLPRE